MLKIEIIETPEQITFMLLGKLYTPWTSELNRVWQEKQEDNRKLVIDLRETTAIDHGGLRLLAEMYREGAKFITSGVLTRYLVDSLRKRNR